MARSLDEWEVILGERFHSVIRQFSWAGTETRWLNVEFAAADGADYVLSATIYDDGEAAIGAYGIETNEQLWCRAYEMADFPDGDRLAEKVLADLERWLSVTTRVVKRSGKLFTRARLEIMQKGRWQTEAELLTFLPRLRSSAMTTIYGSLPVLKKADE